MTILWKVLDILDLFPGLKTNTGAVGVTVTYLLSMFGITEAYTAPIAAFSVALITFGFAMKGARKLNPVSKNSMELKK